MNRHDLHYSCSPGGPGPLASRGQCAQGPQATAREAPPSPPRSGTAESRMASCHKKQHSVRPFSSRAPPAVAPERGSRGGGGTSWQSAGLHFGGPVALEKTLGNATHARLGLSWTLGRISCKALLLEVPGSADPLPLLAKCRPHSECSKPGKGSRCSEL